MEKNEFPPQFKEGDTIKDVLIYGDVSAYIGDPSRNDKTISGTIIDVSHIVRSVYGNKCFYDYQYVAKTDKGVVKFWHSPTFLKPA